MLPIGLFTLFVSIIGINADDFWKQPLSHSAVLDVQGKFHISWGFNKTHISFAVAVQTRGYFGLGFSPNGGMRGSDIVIGWVDGNGNGKLSDRHADGNSQPEIDESQDYVLLNSMENGTHTMMQFIRKIKLCDEDDHWIKAETSRVIWSYNDKDPSGNDALYHGTNRGVRSIYLLDPIAAQPPIPSDVITMDFLNRNVTIPNTDTTYWCSSFEIPQLDRKHHIIKIEPVIQPGREAELHHVLIYACYHNVSESSKGQGALCYTPNMPSEWYACFGLFAAWAIGGGPLYLPEHVGIPLGHEDQPTLFMMETHYDNPTLKEGMVDSSGLRFTLTPTLRTHDAGILYTGSTVSRSHIIPPKAEDFRTDGHCLKECLEQGMGNHTDELNLISIGLHSHVAGTKIRVRHFRDGVEQDILAEDMNYDFNFQEYRHLKEEVKLKKGDNTVVECYYDTKDRDGVTYGGQSTREEMCIAFAIYYPKIPMSMCSTTNTVEYVMQFLGVEIDDSDSVVSPERLKGRYWSDVLENEVDWENPQKRRDFQNWINQQGVKSSRAVCMEAFITYPVHRQHISFPKVSRELAIPDKCPASSALRNRGFYVLSFLAILSIFMFNA